MPVLMVRYQVADEGVAEVVDVIETAFAAVEPRQPGRDPVCVPASRGVAPSLSPCWSLTRASRIHCPH
jgi:hypothetical protein